MRKYAVVIFVVTAILLLSGFPPAAAEGHAVLSREEFERWPYLPEYTVFNPFPNKGGNCTWFAHGRMMQLGYSKYSLDSMRFNANTWADAADRGAVVTDLPEAASIAFWESYAFHGSRLGHVAVVEEVMTDGSILVSDSSSSSGDYRTFIIKPGEGRWPTAFIIVPEGPGRSVVFSPGVIVRTTPHGLNFRLEGVNQPSVLLSKGTLAEISEHPSNGIYSSQPGSVSSYYNWWYAAVEVDSEIKYGWLAEAFLETAGFREPTPDPVLPDPHPDPEPAPIFGDLNGDGLVDARDVAITMQFAIQVREISDVQKTAADVNGDGRVDVLDVVLIMHFALGFIGSFPL
jgi:surface antigen